MIGLVFISVKKKMMIVIISIQIFGYGIATMGSVKENHQYKVLLFLKNHFLCTQNLVHILGL